MAREDFDQAELDAARRKRADLEVAQEAARLDLIRHSTRTLEDFEHLDSRERTQFYEADPERYARFMGEKARIWRERLARGDAHLNIVLDARRKGEAP